MYNKFRIYLKNEDRPSDFEIGLSQHVVQAGEIKTPSFISKRAVPNR